MEATCAGQVDGPVPLSDHARIRMSLRLVLSPAKIDPRNEALRIMRGIGMPIRWKIKRAPIKKVLQDELELERVREEYQQSEAITMTAVEV